MALILEVKVVPLSGRLSIGLDATGTIKCFLKSAPEKGKANKELIKFLAKQLGVTQHDIDIISGLTDRKKRLEIYTSLSYDDALVKLGLDRQKSLFK